MASEVSVREETATPGALETLGSMEPETAARDKVEGTGASGEDQLETGPHEQGRKTLAGY